MRKLLCALLAACLLLPLAGCWNYRGLNEMTIVAGVAIDKSEGLYQMTFEVIDMQQSGKLTGIHSKLVFSQGGSMLESVRNAKRQFSSKLYFGNMQIVILSQQIAEQDGLDSVLDFTLRDSEMRETMQLIVSREDTARALLMNSEAGNGAISYDISRIIREDAKITGATFSAQFYRIYNELKLPGINVALPSFYLATEPGSDKKHIESFGNAVFQHDKLAGFLSAEESKYLLMIDEPISGGVLTLSVPTLTPHNITLEIKKVIPSMSYENNNGKITMKLSVSIMVYFAEFPHSLRSSDLSVLETVTKASEKMVKERLEQVIKKTQTQYQADVLGMGCMIYRTNLPLWRQISDQWGEIYQTLPVDVSVKVHLTNSAMTRAS